MSVPASICHNLALHNPYSPVTSVKGSGETNTHIYMHYLCLMLAVGYPQSSDNQGLHRVFITMLSISTVTITTKINNQLQVQLFACCFSTLYWRGPNSFNGFLTPQSAVPETNPLTSQQLCMNKQLKKKGRGRKIKRKNTAMSTEALRKQRRPPNCSLCTAHAISH